MGRERGARGRPAKKSGAGAGAGGGQPQGRDPGLSPPTAAGGGAAPARGIRGRGTRPALQLGSCGGGTDPQLLRARGFCSVEGAWGAGALGRKNLSPCLKRGLNNLGWLRRVRIGSACSRILAVLRVLRLGSQERCPRGRVATSWGPSFPESKEILLLEPSALALGWESQETLGKKAVHPFRGQAAPPLWGGLRAESLATVSPF